MTSVGNQSLKYFRFLSVDSYLKNKTKNNIQICFFLHSHIYVCTMKQINNIYKG